MSRRKQSRPLRVQDEEIKSKPEETPVNHQKSIMISQNDDPANLSSGSDAIVLSAPKEVQMSDELCAEPQDGLAASNQENSLKEICRTKDEIDDHPDKNNNDSKEEVAKCEAALDLSKIPAFPHLSHVTLETLQNTKVAVAQFAAAALSNTQSSDEALKELSVLQSTLFNLQHQQLFQIQLIQQLQSQLSLNRLEEAKDTLKNVEQYKREIENSPKKECKEESAELEEDDCTSQPLDLHNKCVPEESKDLPEDPIERVVKTEEIIEEPKKSTECPNVEKDCGKKHVPEPVTQPPLCQISSSLASSIITNHDPPPSLDEPNSLEMLQKTAQEVLDSASQGILAGNLADELAFRRDRLSQDGSGRGEPFFKHRCRYCGKVFGSDSALQIHIRSHTGERPFKCNVCASRFTTKGNLKVHYQRHTQRYPTIPMHGGPILEHPQAGMLPMPHGHLSLPPPPVVGPPLGLPFPQGPPNFPPLPQFRPPVDIMKPILPPFHPRLFPPDTPVQPPKEQDEPADLSTPSRKQDISKDADAAKTTTLSVKERIPEEPRSSFDFKKIRLPMIEDSEDYFTDGSESDREQPENLSKMSRRSSISRNSNTPEAAKDNSNSAFPIPVLEDNENMPWENLIEITKTSETSKLQQLVDNIENKLTDPNQCVFCQKILSCRSALQMHYRTHTGERPFRCRICGRAFATKGNLKAHMSIHKIKTPIRGHFKCPVCQRRFPNGLILQQHLKSHAEEREEGSSERNESQDYRDDMRFSPANLSAASDCMTKSESSYGDMDETGTYEDDDTQNPEQQDDFDEGSDIFKEIIRSKYGDTILRQRAFYEAEDRTSKVSGHNFGFLPSTSGFMFPSEEALDLTPQSNAESALRRTSPQVHQRTPDTTPTSTSFMANSLNALLPSSPFSALSAAGSQNSATCSICFKTFPNSSALEVHVRTHVKDRPFKCALCDKTFQTKKEEMAHTTLHYINSKGNLKQHGLTHSRANEQLTNDSSNQSGDDFTNVRRSMKNDSPGCSPSPSVTSQLSENQETGRQSVPSLSPPPPALLKRPLPDIEQPLPKRQMPNSTQLVATPSVSESINQSNNLSRNLDASPPIELLTPSSEPANEQVINTKHFCTICRRNFSSSSALQIHMRTHTGDKPFRCHMCQKAFTTKGNLKVHMGTHMWTNGASRRGRRMSLELPVGRSLPMPPQESDFLQRRPDIFYPYLPQFLNGMQQKFNEINGPQPPPLASSIYPSLGNANIPPVIANKFAGLIGLGPLPPGYNLNIPNLPQFRQMPPLPHADRQHCSPSPDRPSLRFPESSDQSKTRQYSENMTRFWEMQYEQQRIASIDERRLSQRVDSPVPSLSATNRGEELVT